MVRAGFRAQSRWRSNGGFQHVAGIRARTLTRGPSMSCHLSYLVISSPYHIRPFRLGKYHFWHQRTSRYLD
jgi:hypothetical protein